MKRKVPKQDVLSTYNALAFCGPPGQISWFFPTGLETIDVGALLLLVIFIPWCGGRVLHIAQAGLRLMTLLTPAQIEGMCCHAPLYRMPFDLTGAFWRN